MTVAADAFLILIHTHPTAITHPSPDGVADRHTKPLVRFSGPGDGSHPRRNFRLPHGARQRCKPGQVGCDVLLARDAEHVARRLHRLESCAVNQFSVGVFSRWSTTTVATGALRFSNFRPALSRALKKPSPSGSPIGPPPLLALLPPPSAPAGGGGGRSITTCMR